MNGISALYRVNGSVDVSGAVRSILTVCEDPVRTIRDMTDIEELTPTIVDSLIQRIEVHNNDKYDGHCHVKETVQSS